MKIGFIGQGFIGKSYADDFEKREFDIVRYDNISYDSNKPLLKECEVVFIAVPTPTTLNGFDLSIVEEVMGLLKEGTIAVIKSTVVIGSTRKLQEKFKDLIVMHSPEFLTAKTAGIDAANPTRNIIGITKDEHREAAEKVMEILPKAPYEKIVDSNTAELIKYGGNNWFYFKVVYMNILYELAKKTDGNFDDIVEAMSADPRIGSTHLEVEHQGGRGAGGYCFIKDFEAFIGMIGENSTTDMADLHKLALLTTMRDYNIDHLLVKSGKDLELVKGVYGKDRIKKE